MPPALIDQIRFDRSGRLMPWQLGEMEDAIHKLKRIINHEPTFAKQTKMYKGIQRAIGFLRPEMSKMVVSDKKTSPENVSDKKLTFDKKSATRKTKYNVDAKVTKKSDKKKTRRPSH